MCQGTIGTWYKIALPVCPGKSRIVKIGFCFQPSMADNLLPVVVEGFIKNELESDEEILTEIHHPLYSESCHEETANLRYCAK